MMRYCRAPSGMSGEYYSPRLERLMTGLTVAVPNGPMITPLTTGPTFNVFVLLSLESQLREALVNGQIQLSWPADSASWGLQFTPTLWPSTTWTDVTNTPAVVNGHNVLAVPNS